MRYSALFLVIGFILVSGCTVRIGTECMNNDDCVPATCCHASECVTRANAPDCSGIYCSAECAPKTMDCGQGTCICKEGKCTAEIY